MSPELCPECGAPINTEAARCSSCAPVSDRLAQYKQRVRVGLFETKNLVRWLREVAANKSKLLLDDASDAARSIWLPEDPEFILSHSPALEVPAGKGIPGQLANVAWRTDALIVLSALGIASWETEIVTVTRELFHDGPGHQAVSRSLFNADYDAIHKWMDTVPGSGIRGGGIIHRLEHGHDASAAIAVYDEHGLPGLLVWFQHISQDVATPTGIPIPIGGETISGWLVEQGFTTPGKAALALSFNMAELAASFLAGAFALRLASLLSEIATQRKVRKRCEAAQTAWADGDLDAAIAYYSEARTLSEDDPSITLALGWAYTSTGRPAAESFLAFRSAALRLAAGDHLIDLHGTPVSLRGVAYMLALSQSTEVLAEADMRGAWKAELGRMLMSGMASFERVAIAQLERPTLKVRGIEASWRPRPLSAGVNYYLAARMAASAPFLAESQEAPRLAGRAARSLVQSEGLYPEWQQAIARAGSRWRVELQSSPLFEPPPNGE